MSDAPSPAVSVPRENRDQELIARFRERVIGEESALLDDEIPAAKYEQRRALRIDAERELAEHIAELRTECLRLRSMSPEQRRFMDRMARFGQPRVEKLHGMDVNVSSIGYDDLVSLCEDLGIPRRSRLDRWRVTLLHALKRLYWRAARSSRPENPETP